MEPTQVTGQSAPRSRERNVELSQTHQRRDSPASWEVWALLLTDLGSPLASPYCPLVPSDCCSRKGEGHVHVCVCVCTCAWLTMGHLVCAASSRSSQHRDSRFDHRGLVLSPDPRSCVSWGKMLNLSVSLFSSVKRGGSTSLLV